MAVTRFGHGLTLFTSLRSFGLLFCCSILFLFLDLPTPYRLFSPLIPPNPQAISCASAFVDALRLRLFLFRYLSFSFFRFFCRTRIGLTATSAASVDCSSVCWLPPVAFYICIAWLRAHAARHIILTVLKTTVMKQTKAQIIPYNTANQTDCYVSMLYHMHIFNNRPRSGHVKQRPLCHERLD